MPRTRSIAWSELKLGIIAVVAIVLATTMVVALGGQGGFFWQRYPLKMQFNDARGLKSGAVVRLSGKDVGTVTAVEFLQGRIEVVIEIANDVRPFVTTESVGSIGSISLLGESIVDLRAAQAGTPLADWQYVKTVELGTVGDLTTTAAQGLEEAGKLIADVRAGRGSLGKLITDEALYRELEQLVASASTVTRNLNSGKGTIGSLMQDPAAYQAMKASLENLQTMTQRINSGQGPLGRFLNDEAMAKSLSGTLTNLEQSTGRLGRNDNTLGKLFNERELYDRLNSMAARLDEVVGGLEQGRGTAGQLLRDRQLYENMNRAVTEIQALVADIRKDPKKYLRVSVSIF
jgi:phospholipid/cholesterol/gamma-HCH transport system substrate-binding protein